MAAPDETLKKAVLALADGGFLAPEAEARVLFDSAERSGRRLGQLLTRRLRGEPLAWITGEVTFCDIPIRIQPGVFVPRPHTEWLAHRAAILLSDRGVAVDLCTGCGAIAAVLRTARPEATVNATDLDPVAIACALQNGVDALLGDLDEPLPASMKGSVDVVTAVVPYVPTDEMHLLSRDVAAWEPRLALDGGPSGTSLLVQAAEAGARLLRPGGTILLELGGDQAERLRPVLTDLHFTNIDVHRDEDGQARAIEAKRLSD